MDKSALGGLEELSEADKQKMAAIFDQFRIRDSLMMYNSMVEICFTNCIGTFKRKTLDKQEKTCVRRCAQKLLKHYTYAGQRFAELNQDAPN